MNEQQAISAVSRAQGWRSRLMLSSVAFILVACGGQAPSPFTGAQSGGEGMSTQAEPARASTTPRLASSSAAANEARGDLVTVVDGILTARLIDQDLGTVLAAVARQSKIAINADSAIAGARVSANLVRVPLTEGLLRLLEGFDAAFVFRQQGGPATTPSALWVYPKGEAKHQMPPALAESGAGARARASESAITRDEAVDALQNGSAERRTQALEQTIEHRFAVPLPLLNQMILADRRKEVRLLALAALNQSADADPALVRSAAIAALGDPDVEVQNRAKDVLDQLAMAQATGDAVSPP